MIQTHCIGSECLREEPGPCRCECLNCCWARMEWEAGAPGRLLRIMGGLMEELAWSVRKMELGEKDVIVLTFPDELTQEQRERIWLVCREELALERNRVIILEKGAHVTTTFEALETMRALLDDAARSLWGLIGVAQHAAPHPDAIVAQRDQRIVEYARGSAEDIRRYLMENEQPVEREALEA